MIDKLAEHFEKFPGIGKRQAKRFVYFLLTSSPNYLNELINLISKLKEEINQCPSCFLYHSSKEKSLCKICKDPKTNKTLLMIVEKDVDYENINKSKLYPGKYFIIGGSMPIIEKNVEKEIRIKELLIAVEKQAKENKLAEIVLALSLNPQGEQMDIYLRKTLCPLKEKYNFKISSLGRGLSTGTELEYSDDQTIQNALKNRS